MSNTPDFAGLEDFFATLNQSADAKPQASVQTNTATAPAPKAPQPVQSTGTATVQAPTQAQAQNALLTAQTKINNIGIEMNNLFVERDQVIRLMQLALISGTNVLMLGMPGTAKSMLTYDFCGRIENANYFQWMLNKTSDPSEILGPISVKGMENDQFIRKTAGKLPEAHIAFLDEIFKSNSPTLNALLTIMNEHIFYNDGVAVDIPLISLIGASNEPPEDDSLAAMYDRFIFRINVQYVSDVGNKKRMHSNYIQGRAGTLGLAGKATITLDEIKILQQAAKAMPVPRDIINQFIRLITDLERKAIKVSDRRQNECFKVMQASAVLRGAKQVGLDDFRSLIYVLWEKEDQISEIETTILKQVNPFDDKFKELKEQYAQIKKDIEGITDATEKSKKSIESKSVIEKLVSRVNKLVNEATKNGKDTADFVEFRDEMVKYGQDLIASALGTNFNGI